MIPLFAGALILLHYILVTAVTPPVNGGLGIRYLVYWFLIISSSIGTNLIAVYLGYTAELTKHPWRKSGRLIFYLLIVGLLSIIWSAVFFKSFAARDLWLFLFPISHHDFPFAASILIWYILGPFLVKALKKLTIKAKHALLVFLFLFILVLPFIFYKPLWGINDASNVIWVGMLFIFGILIAQGEFKWTADYKKNWLVIIVILAIVAFLVRYMPIAQDGTTIRGRFFTNYSLPIGLVSIASFGILRKWLTKHLKRFSNLSWPNWFALIAYLISSLPLISYNVGKNLKIPENISSSIKWLIWLIGYFLILFIINLLVTFLLFGLKRIGINRRLIDKLTIHHFSDLANLPTILKKILHENWHLLLVIVCGFVFVTVQMIMMRLATTSFSWSLFNDLFVSSSPQIILNIIIFIAFFYLLFSLINRFWPALLFTGGVSIFIAVAEFLKISLREEPILPADLKMITAISEIAQMISPIIIVVAANKTQSTKC